MQDTSTPYGYFKCVDCGLFYPLRYQQRQGLKCLPCGDGCSIGFTPLFKRQAEELRSMQERAFRSIFNPNPIG